MSERRHLPDERPAITRRFEIGGTKCYVTVGLFADGSPGEVFVRIAKTGGTLSGLLDNWAITMSLALQHGVPLETLIDKMAYTRFEPAGWSGVDGIGYATSVLDLIMRWIKIRFLAGTPALPPPLGSIPPPPVRFTPEVPVRLTPPEGTSVQLTVPQSSLGDGPVCERCGALTRPSGSCHACPNCGWTSGCS